MNEESISELVIQCWIMLAVHIGALSAMTWLVIRTLKTVRKY